MGNNGIPGDHPNDRILEEYDKALARVEAEEQGLRKAESRLSAAKVKLEEAEERVVALLDHNKVDSVRHRWLGSFRINMNWNGSPRIEKIRGPYASDLETPPGLLTVIVPAEAATDSPTDPEGGEAA